MLTFFCSRRTHKLLLSAYTERQEKNKKGLRRNGGGSFSVMGLPHSYGN